MERRRIDVGWGELAVTISGNPEGQRLLCLHGWMDNAASFEPLAEAMPEACWVSLDYAGHGASDHRPPPSRYYLTDYFLDLDRVLDELGWDHCTLVSHSMGTGVASFYACADPQRIDRIIMLDGLGVATEEAGRAAERVASSLKSIRHPRDHRRVFESPAQAAAIRMAKTPMSERSANLLVDRALKKDEDGWRWRTDPGAMWSSPFWMTENQAREILRGIKCPVLVVITETLEEYLGERVEQRLALLADVTAERFAGGHHLHMDNPEAIRDSLKAFLEYEDMQHD